MFVQQKEKSTIFVKYRTKNCKDSDESIEKCKISKPTT